MDAKTKGVAVADARQVLLKFYDQLPGHEDYNEIDKEDFFELTDRFRNERKRAAKEADKQMFQEKHHSMGPPPKKAAIGLVPGRTPSGSGLPLVARGGPGGSGASA